MKTVKGERKDGDNMVVLCDWFYFASVLFNPCALSVHVCAFTFRYPSL